MPSCDVRGPCPYCGKSISETVWYTVPEETSAKFWKVIWKWMFVFGLTAMAFTWCLVLMLKEYEVKRLEKVLAHPDATVEDIWYSDGNPGRRSDSVKISKEPKDVREAKHLIELSALQVEIEMLKKEVEKSKKKE